MNIRWLKKGDLLLVTLMVVIIGVMSLATGVFQGQDDQKRIAVIKQENRLIERIDLEAVIEPRTIFLSGKYPEVILVEKGRIRFYESDCPDQVCVRTGWLSKKGQTAVCIPNKAVIKIEGEDRKVDGVTY